MGMKIEFLFRVPVDHVADAGINIVRAEHAQGIRQQEAVDAAIQDPIHQAEHVLRFIAVAVGPVFQIHIDLQPLVMSVLDSFAYVRQVLLQGFIQLGAAVFFAALGQQVHGFATGLGDPVNAALVVDKPQHFDPLQVTLGGGPLVDGGDGRLFTFRYLCGSDLNSVDTESVQ